MKDVLAIVCILLFVILFSIVVSDYSGTHCKKRCAPNEYEIVGRDAICFCHLKLQSGEIVLMRPK